MKNTLISGSVITDKKSEDLEKQVAALQKMVEQLMASKTTNEVVEKNDKFGEIAPNEYIKIMSLVGDKLNLSTRPHGKGRTFGFDKFGEVKKILFSDVLEINENHKNFLEAGYYYILDERVVRNLGLEYLYEKILKKDQIEQVLSGTNQALSLFESCNFKQRSMIINFFIQKIVDDEKIDYNLISNISRIADVDIMKKVQDIKETKDGIKKIVGLYPNNKK